LKSLFRFYVMNFAAIAAALMGVACASNPPSIFTLQPRDEERFHTEKLSLEQRSISALGFLIGNWGGPGISYRDDGTQFDYYDTEFVRYDLDKSILLINARGERPDGSTSYRLHTIIYYDAKREHYIYTPYSGKTAPRSFECALEAGPKLLCYTKERNYRLTFQRLSDGRWNEFGERLDNEEWKKNFETILRPIKP